MVLQGERKTRNGSLNERYKNLSPPGVVSSRKNEEKKFKRGRLELREREIRDRLRGRRLAKDQSEYHSHWQRAVAMQRPACVHLREGDDARIKQRWRGKEMEECTCGQRLCARTDPSAYLSHGLSSIPIKSAGRGPVPRSPSPRFFLLYSVLLKAIARACFSPICLPLSSPPLPSRHYRPHEPTTKHVALSSSCCSA
jgi:hypothetical protein